MIFLSEPPVTSFQGTGHLLGVKQRFARFSGCSVAACPIRAQCDEPGALTRKGAQAWTAKDLVEDTLEAVGPGGWLHITGGEPTDQDDGLQKLVMLARDRGLKVHIQSSGVRAVRVQWDWLSISPKTDPLVQTFGQECCVVDDGRWTLDRLAALRSSTKFWVYYLVPLSLNMGRTEQLARDSGWDLTIQAHKYWGVR
jgi:organic radical activating enzyme